jgi:hypothetical protein
LPIAAIYCVPDQVHALQRLSPLKDSPAFSMTRREARFRGTARLMMRSSLAS